MKRIDPRQLKSKEKLHEAYLTMSRAQDQFTIQQLCDVAEVTRPTFYKLYRDIQELRIDLHKVVLSELHGALTITNPRPLAEVPKEEMPTHLTLLFKHIQAERIAYETFFVHQPDALFINGVKEIVKQFVTNGIRYAQTLEQKLRTNLSFVTSFITGAYMESIVFWIEENYRTSPEEMASSLIDISLYGPYFDNPTNR